MGTAHQHMDSEHIQDPAYTKFYRTQSYSFLGDCVPNPLRLGSSSQGLSYSLPAQCRMQVRLVMHRHTCGVLEHPSAV